MEEESIFFSGDTSYLSSLIGSRANLTDSPTLLTLLDEVILVELELALAGANKAKSELTKGTSNVRPIK